jgi:hypothetical protein
MKLDSILERAVVVKKCARAAASRQPGMLEHSLK